MNIHIAVCDTYTTQKQVIYSTLIKVKKDAHNLKTKILTIVVLNKQNKFL